MENFVTIERGLFAELIEARAEAEMLKRLLMDNRYVGIGGKEVAMLCNLLGLDKE